MYDGSIKMVQDIKINDLLMGDNSNSRKVLTLCSGHEQLYRIIPKYGDSYVVNKYHILSLKSCFINSGFKKGEIYDMDVEKYINLPFSIKKKLKGYRVGVEFQRKSISIDPYLFGYDKIGNNEENKNNNIPNIYKCNSREIRLELLAGILDANGNYCSDKKCYNLEFKNKEIVDDIIYLSRSLGFASYIYEFNNNNSSKLEEYYRFNIFGDGIENIPCKSANKMEIKENNNKKNNSNVLITGIRVEKIEIGDYFGFTIDGNQRFLLGDFTVTHNSS